MLFQGLNLFLGQWFGLLIQVALWYRESILGLVSAEGLSARVKLLEEIVDPATAVMLRYGTLALDDISYDVQRSSLIEMALNRHLHYEFGPLLHAKCFFLTGSLF